MKKNLSIITTENIFRLRNYLQQISSISFTFSKVNQRYPIDKISEEEGQQVIKVYENLLKDTETVINTYKNFNLNLNNKNGKQTTNSTT
jgi:hypothetical protein